MATKENQKWVTEWREGFTKSRPLLMQPYVHDCAELYEKILLVDGTYHEFVKAFAAETGGEYSPPPGQQRVKDKSRTEEKARANFCDRQGNVAWFRILDISRSSIVYQDWASVYEAAKKLKDAHGEFVAGFDDRIPNGAFGKYCDFQVWMRSPYSHTIIQTLPELPKDMVSELQLHARPLIQAKGLGGGHAGYQVQRAFTNACKKGNAGQVARCLESKADLNAADGFGRSPVMLAAMNSQQHGSLEIVRLLHQKRADMSQKDNLGNTSLHHAAQLGCLQMCWLLLSEASVSTSSVNLDGNTPADVSHVDVKELLAAKDAELSSALQQALKDMDEDSVDDLISRGANPTRVLAVPAWEAAATFEHPMIAMRLVQHMVISGINPRISRASDGLSFADVAELAGNEEAHGVLQTQEPRDLRKDACRAVPNEPSMRSAAAFLQLTRKRWVYRECHGPEHLELMKKVLDRLAHILREFGTPFDRTWAIALLRRSGVNAAVAALLGALLTCHCRNGCRGSMPCRDIKDGDAAKWRDVIRAALNVLDASMANSPENRLDITDAFGMERAAEALTRFSGEGPETVLALRCLCKLCVSGNAARAHGVNSMGLAVSALRHRWDDARIRMSVMNWGTGLLRNITQWAFHEDFGNEKDGVETVIQTLEIVTHAAEVERDVTSTVKHCVQILECVCGTTHLERLRRLKTSRGQSLEELVQKAGVVGAAHKIPSIEDTVVQRLLGRLTAKRLTVIVDLHILRAHEDSHIQAGLKKASELIPTLLELSQAHQVILALPVCGNITMLLEWVERECGKDWMSRLVVTEHVELVYGDVLLIVHHDSKSSSRPQHDLAAAAIHIDVSFSLEEINNDISRATALSPDRSPTTLSPDRSPQRQRKSLSCEQRKRILLVDQDNTLNSFNEHVADVAKTERGILPKSGSLNNSRVADDFAPGDVSYIKSIFKRPGFYEQLRATSGAALAMQRLRSQYETFIVTGLPKWRSAADEKSAWIEKTLGWDWASRVVFTDQKTLIMGDFLIDDANEPRGTVGEASWKHIAFARPWNCGHQMRVNSWAEVDGKLEELCRAIGDRVMWT